MHYSRPVHSGSPELCYIFFHRTQQADSTCFHTPPSYGDASQLRNKWLPAAAESTVATLVRAAKSSVVSSLWLVVLCASD